MATRRGLAAISGGASGCRWRGGNGDFGALIMRNNEETS